MSYDNDAALREVLGYLNFSSGKPDARFQSSLNALTAEFGPDRPWSELQAFLSERLDNLQQESSAFQDSEQARQVIPLTLETLYSAYRLHHADLLFHLAEADFREPLFLARLFEAVLAQGPPWEKTERVVQGALDQLNDFLGFRPLAVLQNGRKLQPYPHERHRPIPLYIREAGVGAGRHHALIRHTLQFLEETPESVLRESEFYLSQLDELAVDLRSHDHTHPVNKRTNYMFGEWDPDVIDTKGYYRRFVIRKIILDALAQWMQDHDDMPPEELLYDASAVLCGTMLMASAISGGRPDSHDSSVTLTSLLPRVAHQRDTFYARLLDEAEGARADRLHREAEQTQQPFGHVRQYLNMYLAGYGARQVQHRHLAQLYARMGYPEAAREEAAVIPAVSSRFECEIQCRLTTGHRQLDHSDVKNAAAIIPEIEDHLQRGIECGALIDPWNILGFQGQFPLFSSREDSVPDHRAETLLEFMEQLFGLYSRALGEAAVQGEGELIEQLSAQFRKTAEQWDRYATPAVEDLPEVLGRESWDSAQQVAQALENWRQAGESAGDISFWRQHVDRFQSAKAYALVVRTLLEKRDHVAAMGLLIQWLSQADQVGLEAGPHSAHGLLLEWMSLVTGSEGESVVDGDPWPTVRRLFDFLEANAGNYWSVPDFRELTGQPGGGDNGLAAAEDHDIWQDDEDELFEAAYDDVIYRDSALDGQMGETLDGGYNVSDTEFETIHRELEPRLRFLDSLAQLWAMSGATFARQAGETAPGDEAEETADAGERQDILLGWRNKTRALQQELMRLVNAIWEYEVTTGIGDHDANIEYDIQLQTKFYLLHAVIATYVSCKHAERCLLCCLPPSVAEADLSQEERRVVEAYRGILTRDAAEVRRLLPKLRKQVSGKPLLYVPFDNGGHPKQVLTARSLQAVFRFLLAELPRLGLLRETHGLLKTAYRMERNSRPGGPAVTEFDRLFRTALKNSLECVVQSSTRWRSGRFSDEELIEIVGDIVERYLDLWLKHSGTMRLSTAEALQQDVDWNELKQFIATYGHDLFHAKFLTLGNVRAILHNGVESFLAYLDENRDPLHPMRLLEDLDRGVIDRDQVVEYLRLIYGTVVDKFDRFVEYNTTTTQSDYGEKFYCLLEFLAAEAAYERDSWNLAPVGVAHEVLVRLGKTEAALVWERVFRAKTDEMADRHLKTLGELENKYSMRLPSVRDHFNERFVKPLAVDRMVALVPRAMEQPDDGEAFARLRAEVNEYLASTSGSGVDIAPWLQSLEKEIDRVDAPSEVPRHGMEPELQLPPVHVNLREMRRQLNHWDEPSGGKKKGGRKRRDDDE